MTTYISVPIKAKISKFGDNMSYYSEKLMCILEFSHASFPLYEIVKQLISNLINFKARTCSLSTLHKYKENLHKLQVASWSNMQQG